MGDGEFARAMLELVDRGSWGELDPAEREVFAAWCSDGVKGVDLYLLLVAARSRWRRQGRQSSSPTFQAIADTALPREDEDG